MLEIFAQFPLFLDIITCSLEFIIYCALISKSASKDVYKIVTGDKSWIYALWSSFEVNPTTVDSARSTPKQMVALRYIVAIVLLVERLSAIEVFREMRKTNRRRRIILHHDNARSQTSAQQMNSWVLTTQNIKTSNWLVIRRTALIWQPMTTFYSRT